MLTTDPTDPRLTHGHDEQPVPQAEAYIVMSADERAKGFVRPVRDTYVHEKCGTPTTMALALAETYARDTKFYGATYCCVCRMHRPVGEFTWKGTHEIVGS